MTSVPKAVVLLSGGLDSATVLAFAKKEGFRPFALSFRYGQRHTHEVEAARRVAETLGVEAHQVLDINLAAFGGSALTSRSLAVPKHHKAEQIGEHIPITYVPARNTVFLSLALAWSEVVGTGHIFIGVNALDYSGYPDCRLEYVEAFERMANLATKTAVEGTLPITIHTPLIHHSKAEIIRLGVQLGVDYSLTRSCYDPTEDDLACGNCDACLLRLRGFAENHIPDPIQYAHQ
jgi:7-cyano-7-deazaguanine synthase